MTDLRPSTEELQKSTSLADLILRAPGSERILEAHGLDYCCGGQRTLAEACEPLGVDPDAVLDEIGRAEPTEAPAWDSMGPAELVDHVESTHHAYLHSEMGRLSELANKVAGVHGANHPELAEIRDVYEAFKADMEPHLMKEERMLFPMIRELAAATEAPSFHCGSLKNPISVMLAEHDVSGAQLARIRELTDDYQTPADGCASYQALFAGLAQLEEDTILHVHKENNILFPGVVALEETFA